MYIVSHLTSSTIEDTWQKTPPCLLHITLHHTSCPMQPLSSDVLIFFIFIHVLETFISQTAQHLR